MFKPNQIPINVWNRKKECKTAGIQKALKISQTKINTNTITS